MCWTKIVTSLNDRKALRGRPRARGATVEPSTAHVHTRDTVDRCQPARNTWSGGFAVERLVATVRLTRARLARRTGPARRRAAPRRPAPSTAHQPAAGDLRRSGGPAARGRRRRAAPCPGQRARHLNLHPDRPLLAGPQPPRGREEPVVPAVLEVAVGRGAEWCTTVKLPSLPPRSPRAAPRATGRACPSLGRARAAGARRQLR